jgi:deoxycytidylate deaminase
MPDTKRKVQPKICPPTHDYIMGVAFVVAAACKDPTGQQAAIVVDQKDRIIAHGVNFLVCGDTYQSQKMEWDAAGRRTGMITAAEAALDRALKIYTPGAIACEPFIHHTLYMTGPPLLRDLRRCISLGLKKIIYGSNDPLYFDNNEWDDTLDLAVSQGATVELYKGNLNWLRDKVHSISHLF